MQDRFFTFHDKGMAGIMPSLKAHNGGDGLGKQVNNFAFTLISPLKTKY